MRSQELDNNHKCVLNPSFQVKLPRKKAKAKKLVLTNCLFSGPNRPIGLISLSFMVFLLNYIKCNSSGHTKLTCSRKIALTLFSTVNHKNLNMYICQGWKFALSLLSLCILKEQLERFALVAL